MSLDRTILHWIHDTLTCPLLDFLMPKISALGSGGAIWLLVVSVLICTKKYRRQGLLLLAAAIGFSRLYLYVHFPSDVLAAAVLGIAIGAAVMRCGRRWLR